MFVFFICLPLAFAAVYFTVITSVLAASQSPAPSNLSAGQKTAETGAVAAPAADLHQNSIQSGPTSTGDRLQNSIQSGPTFTAETRSSVESRQSGTAGSEPEQQTVIDVFHAHVSHGIQGTATWMDSFFGDRRYESELNESYVRVAYDVFKEESVDFVRPKPDVRIRIILPQLRRKTRLVFSGSPSKERTDFSAIGNETDSPTTEGQEGDVVAGVQEMLLDTIKNNLSIRVGVRLHNKKPMLVFGPRYRVLLPLDSWQLRFIEEMLWSNQEGWDSLTTFDAERKLLEKLFFRASNTLSWTQHVDGFIYAVSFGVAQQIGESRALGYEWINSFHTQPINELTDVVLRVRYRQQLWSRKWVFFEVAPQYHFPRDNGFRGLAGILFRLEMLFGNYR